MIVLLFIANFSYSQQIQWASKIIDFSSEWAPKQNSAKQILGEPNAYPQAGEHPSIWIPGVLGAKAYVKVSFDSAQFVRQVAIVETLRPGYIDEVFLYDEKDKEYSVYKSDPVGSPLEKNILKITLPLTSYKVKSLKISLNTRGLNEKVGIDAVAIGDDEFEVNKDILILPNMSEVLNMRKSSMTINSPYQEISPLVSLDGKMLFFSRRGDPENIGGITDLEDIWYSWRDEAMEDWDKAINMGRPLNNSSANFIASVGSDGDRPYLILGNQYLGEDYMESGISISYWENDNWGLPKSLFIKKENNKSLRVNYYLSYNRKILLISAERTESQGNRDLYVSFLLPEGTWSEPSSLGTAINTAGEEFAPFLESDNKTLYFSSSGHPGYGGYDIFVTTRLDDTWKNWSTPYNLGPQINSKYNDQYLHISDILGKGLITRDDSLGNADIYEFDLPINNPPNLMVKVRGKVLDSNSNIPLGADIVFERLSDGTIVARTKSDPITGEYEVSLPIGEEYLYRALIEGYLPISVAIDLRKLLDDKAVSIPESGIEISDLMAGNDSFEGNIYPVKAIKGNKAAVRHIFFDFDKAVLKQKSFRELDRIAKFLLDNPTIEIEVSGHTDSIGDDAYNQKLSEKRAQAVRQYLIEKGVSENRLTAVGYGEVYPISNNMFSFGRELNRRVELMITKE